MKTYNFGIVGTGLIADFHAKAIGDIPNAKIAGCYDAVADRTKQFAEKHSCKGFDSLDDMAHSDEIDIITVATPSGAHMEPVIAAAEGGKHAICEKPLEVTLDRVDAMVEAHKKAGTLLGGIFQNRFTDAQKPLRDAIQSGRFGTITYAGVYVPWWRSDEYYTNSWHGSWKLDGGGALMNQSCHMIDMLCDLMPPVESVMAYADNRGHPQIEAEDTAAAALRFKGGALGIIYGTSASFPGQFKRFEISGTKGTVVYLEDSFTVWQFADERPEDATIRKQFGQVDGLGSVDDPAAIKHTNHTRNFRAFIDSLESGNDFVLNGREARKAVQLILAIYESAKERKEIVLA
ncbi:MAG: gfo/Idh/MocA family oxidoreductase [Chitinivibrionales bacterium]|nr:gfo/Idh/MocA family oxidoreductase [Chitinivibrionales bacterium]